MKGPQAQAQAVRDAQAAELNATIVAQRWREWCYGAGAAAGRSEKGPRSRRERLAFFAASARIALATMIAPTPSWADKWQWRGLLANPMALALTETAPEVLVERCDEDCGGANIRLRWGGHVLHLHFTTVELAKAEPRGGGSEGDDGLRQAPPEGASSHGRRVFVFERGSELPPELAAVLRGSLPPEMLEAMGIGDGADAHPNNNSGERALDPDEVV